MAHAQAFMLPAQQGSEVSMGAISQRSDSMGSIRSEDSCDNQSGTCYDHLERHSPTSLLPEHPFSPPVLKVNPLPPQPENTTVSPAMRSCGSHETLLCQYMCGAAQNRVVMGRQPLHAVLQCCVSS